jgi:hypothetical protein
MAPESPNCLAGHLTERKKHMSIGARREYLKAIWFRYRQSSRKEKSVILTEYINVTGLNRKYAIWRLSQPLDRFDGSRRADIPEFILFFRKLRYYFRLKILQRVGFLNTKFTPGPRPGPWTAEPRFCVGADRSPVFVS